MSTTFPKIGKWVQGKQQHQHQPELQKWNPVTNVCEWVKCTRCAPAPCGLTILFCPSSLAGVLGVWCWRWRWSPQIIISGTLTWRWVPRFPRSARPAMIPDPGRLRSRHPCTPGWPHHRSARGKGEEERLSFAGNYN